MFSELITTYSGLIEGQQGNDFVSPAASKRRPRERLIRQLAR
jgi:hypothetical protein